MSGTQRVLSVLSYGVYLENATVKGLTARVNYLTLQSK